MKHNRTSKLFFTTLLSLGLMGLNSVFAQSGKRVYTFPLGVEAYTYRHNFPKDVVATLDLIKSLGFTEMEGGVPKGLTAEEYKKLLDERGIKMTATGAGYEQIVKDPESVVKNAKALGASFVMVAWIPHQKGNFTLENAQKAVEDFNRVGKVLKDNGLTFCYHNHGYEFQPYQDGTLFDYIVKNTDPQYVSFEMDILWATHGGADPVKLLTKYGSRWKLMHLKDLKKGIKGDLTGGTPPENDVVLGEGQIDMPAVLKAAKKVGIKHYYIEDESNHEDTQVPQSIAYLKNLTE
ncbi:sugar phosphate isomerase/epimerase [Spirosoma taeanense]|uniref:Sugar phosphate isomerase/epimerase n=1 Tax=Spirosoma taeanense TaxID=2735870 RepID=A0A6M5YAY8_9BACT|nr:sugar phosphate isomerase/epimerase [Spirosoma taeanense]QJW90042.1 sugar phosphate isomerase/epimerase [Spirosoma taeanense]